MLTLAAGITKARDDMAGALICYRKQVSRWHWYSAITASELNDITIYLCFDLLLIPAIAAQIDQRAESQYK
jgi:hypothetical protein